MAIGLEAIFKTDDFAGGLKEYLAGIRDAEDKTGSASKSITAGLSALGGTVVLGALAALTAAVAAAAGAAIAAVPAFLDWASTVDSIGDVLGTSAEDSSTLAVAIQHVGGNVDAITGQMAFLTRGLVDAQGEIGPTGEVLEELGISFKDANGQILPATDILTAVADHLSTLPDGLEKTALMTRLFGKSGKDLTDTLNALTTEGFAEADALAKELGLSLGDDAVAGAVEFGKQMEVLKMAGKGLFVQLGQALMPAVMDLAKQFMTLVRGALPKVREMIPRITAVITGMAKFILQAIPAVFKIISDVFNFLINNKPLVVGVLTAIAAAVAVWAYTTITAAIPAITAMVTAMAPLIATLLVIGGVAAALYWAWENNFLGMRDTLTAFWETTVQPALAELWTWLQVNIPKAIEVLKTYWETVLLPAIKTVVSWIAAKLVPILKDVFEWLKVNLPKAIDVLEKFWTDVLLPAIEAVWAWMQDTLFPLFEDLWEWLQKTIPAAIETLKRFWENTLLPAIKSVWSWIQNTLFPLFDQLWAWLQNTIPQAIQTLKGYWENTLLPAIKAVWAWMDTVLFPFLETLVDFLDSVFGAALRTLAGVWKEKLLPAIKDVAGWVEDHVLPAFKKFTDWLTKTFKPVVEGAGRALRNAFSAAFDWVTRRIKELTDKLQWLIDLLDKIGGGDDGGGGGGTPKPPPTCFAAGTPVATPEGDRPIEAIQPGDAVLVLEESGRLVAAEVAETIRDHHDQVVTVALSDGQRLTCSLNHRFRTLAGAWVWARDLAPGTQLTPIYAEQAWVTAVEPRAGAIDVYNLHVGHTEHTYIAGGVVVHNAKPDESSAGLTGSLSAASSAATPSATVANIVNNFSLGGNTIVSPMDAAVFEARVEAAVQRALSVV